MKTHEPLTLSRKSVVYWIMLVVVGIVFLVSFVLADAVNKPKSPQAMVAEALNEQPRWRPLPDRTGLTQAASRRVYYDPTIRDIIRRDCSQCHSGNLRNLMDYDSLLAYVDSGMLEAMLQGPMGQFAGKDAGTILAWIEAGAPEHASKATTPATAALNVRMPAAQTTAQGGWRPLPNRVGIR